MDSLQQIYENRKQKDCSLVEAAFDKEFLKIQQFIKKGHSENWLFEKKVSMMIFDFQCKFKGKIEITIIHKKLLEFAVQLISIKCQKIAWSFCVRPYFQYHKYPLEHVFSSDSEIVEAFFSEGLQGDFTSKILQILMEKGASIYFKVKKEDPKLLYEESHKQMLKSLQFIKGVIMVAVRRSDFYWLVYNGTVHIYNITRHMIEHAYFSQCLPFLLWGFACLDSVIPLDNLQYLTWLVQYLFLVVTCMFRMSLLTEGNQIIDIIQARLSSFHHQGDSDNTFQDPIDHLRKILKIFIFQSKVLLRIKSKDVVEESSVKLFPPVSKDSKWPRNSVENYLNRIFEDDYTSMLQAIFEMLSFSSIDMEVQVDLCLAADYLIFEKEEVGVDFAIALMIYTYNGHFWDLCNTVSKKLSDYLEKSNDTTQFSTQQCLLDVLKLVLRSHNETAPYKLIKHKNQAYPIPKDILLQLAQALDKAFNYWNQAKMDNDFLIDALLILWTQTHKVLYEFPALGFYQKIWTKIPFEWKRILKVIFRCSQVSQIHLIDPIFSAEICLRYAYLLEALAFERLKINKPISTNIEANTESVSKVDAINYLTKANKVAEVGLVSITEARRWFGKRCWNSLCPYNKLQKLIDEQQSTSGATYTDEQLKTGSTSSVLPTSRNHIVSHLSNPITATLTELNVEMFNICIRIEMQLAILMEDPLFKKGGKIPVTELFTKKAVEEKFQKTILTKSLLLMNKAVLETSDASNKQLLLEKSLHCIAKYETELKGQGELITEPVDTHVQKPTTLPPPVLLKRDDIRMKFKPPVWKADKKIVWYKLFGKAISGPDKTVRLSDHSIPGTGVLIPTERDIILVWDLEPFTYYAFALAAFDDQGRLIGKIGESTTPLQATFKLSSLTTRILLIHICCDLKCFSVALKCSDSLWESFSHKTTAVPGEKEFNSYLKLMKNLTSSHFSISDSIWNNLSPIIHYSFLNSMIESIYCFLQSIGLISTSLISKASNFKQQVIRLEHCLKMKSVIELAKLKNAKDVILQCSLMIYGLLVPFIQYSVHLPITKELIGNNVVNLKDCTSSFLLQESFMKIVLGIVEAVGCMIRYLYNNYLEKGLQKDLITVIKDGIEIIRRFMEFKSEPDLSDIPVNDYIKEFTKVKMNLKTNHRITPPCLKALEILLMGLVKNFSFVKDLTGSEDVVLLHAAINSLPVEEAYSVLGKFKHHSKFLHLLIPLLQVAIREGHYRDVEKWSNSVIEEMGERDNSYLSSMRSTPQTNVKPTKKSSGQESDRKLKNYKIVRYIRQTVAKDHLDKAQAFWLQAVAQFLSLLQNNPESRGKHVGTCETYFIPIDWTSLETVGGVIMPLCDSGKQRKLSDKETEKVEEFQEKLHSTVLYFKRAAHSTTEYDWCLMKIVLTTLDLLYINKKYDHLVSLGQIFLSIKKFKNGYIEQIQPLLIHSSLLASKYSVKKSSSKKLKSAKASCVIKPTPANLLEQFCEDLGRCERSQRFVLHARQSLILYFCQNIMDHEDKNRKIYNILYMPPVSLKSNILSPEEILQGKLDQFQESYFTDIPVINRFLVTANYKKAIEVLNKEDPKSLPKVLDEFASVYCFWNDIEHSQKLWQQALDMIMEPMSDCLKDEVTQTKANHFKFLQSLGLEGCILGGILTTKLSRYTHFENYTDWMEKMSLARILFKSVFAVSVHHPVDDLDFADYDVPPGTPLIPPALLASNSWSFEPLQILSALDWLVEQLLFEKFPEMAFPLITLKIYISEVLVTNHIEVLKSYVFRIQALAEVHQFSLMIKQFIRFTQMDNKSLFMSSVLHYHKVLKPNPTIGTFDDSLTMNSRDNWKILSVVLDALRDQKYLEVGQVNLNFQILMLKGHMLSLMWSTVPESLTINTKLTELTEVQSVESTFQSPSELQFIFQKDMYRTVNTIPRKILTLDADLEEYLQTFVAAEKLLSTCYLQSHLFLFSAFTMYVTLMQIQNHNNPGSVPYILWLECRLNLVTSLYALQICSVNKGCIFIDPLQCCAEGVAEADIVSCARLKAKFLLLLALLRHYYGKDCISILLNIDKMLDNETFISSNGRLLQVQVEIFLAINIWDSLQSFHPADIEILLGYYIKAESILHSLMGPFGYKKEGPHDLPSSIYNPCLSLLVYLLIGESLSEFSLAIHDGSAEQFPAIEEKIDWAIQINIFSSKYCPQLEACMYFNLASVRRVSGKKIGSIIEAYLMALRNLFMYLMDVQMAGDIFLALLSMIEMPSVRSVTEVDSKLNLASQLSSPARNVRPKSPGSAQAGSRKGKSRNSEIEAKYQLAFLVISGTVKMLEVASIRSQVQAKLRHPKDISKFAATAIPQAVILDMVGPKAIGDSKDKIDVQQMAAKTPPTLLLSRITACLDLITWPMLLNYYAELHKKLVDSYRSMKKSIHTDNSGNEIYVLMPRLDQKQQLLRYRIQAMETFFETHLPSFKEHCKIPMIYEDIKKTFYADAQTVLPGTLKLLQTVGVEMGDLSFLWKKMPTGTNTKVKGSTMTLVCATIQDDDSLDADDGVFAGSFEVQVKRYKAVTQLLKGIRKVALESSIVSSDDIISSVMTLFPHTPPLLKKINGTFDNLEILESFFEKPFGRLKNSEVTALIMEVLRNHPA